MLHLRRLYQNKALSIAIGSTLTLGIAGLGYNSSTEHKLNKLYNETTISGLFPLSVCDSIKTIFNDEVSTSIPTTENHFTSFENSIQIIKTSNFVKSKEVDSDMKSLLNDFAIISGSSSLDLTNEICQLLG